jgi:hypothetical protein
MYLFLNEQRYLKYSVKLSMELRSNHEEIKKFISLCS